MGTLNHLTGKRLQEMRMLLKKQPKDPEQLKRLGSIIGIWADRTDIDPTTLKKRWEENNSFSIQMPS